MQKFTAILLLIGSICFFCFFSLVRVQASASGVVIRQVYGAGGTTGALYLNDFVELFNAGNAPVALNGWSLQYASTSGSFGSITPLPNFALQPGQYFLIQLGSSGTQGEPLPTPDLIGTTGMSTTSGKVALVNGIDALSCGSAAGDCFPGGTALPSIVDFVGYGTANNYEGSGAAPTLSPTTAAIRHSASCFDHDNNLIDFLAATPAPHNSASPFEPCFATPTPTSSFTATATATFTPSPTPSATTPFTNTPQNTASLTNTLPAETATTVFTVTPGSEFTSTPTITPITGVELLLNGDFEAKNSEGKADLTPWTIKNASQDKIKCAKPGKPPFAYSGNCAFRFKGSPDESSQLLQNAAIGHPFMSGDTLRLTFYTDTTSFHTVGKVKLRVKYTDATKGKLTMPLIQSFGYIQYTNVLVLSSSNIALIKLQISHRSIDANLFIDGINLVWETNPTER